MKFNSFLRKSAETVNHEGAKAYLMTPEFELYSAVVTASLSDKFYESGDELIARIARLVKEVDPEFVARLAVYTRSKMNLRSVPMLLLVELARVHNGDNLVSRAVAATVQRADEIVELLACYAWRNKRNGTKKLGKLSNQLRLGLQMAFNKFDEYQFAKYNRKGDITLSDALFIVHPKAKDEAQQEIFDKIALDCLEVPYTWEVELSRAGQEVRNEEERQQLFALTWEKLVRSGKLGYMALLRNLRNITQSHVSHQVMELVCRRLADPEAVAQSRQFPFRFLAAFREMKEVTSPFTTAVLDALEDAAMASAQNIPGFEADERILLACDVSGSMQQSVSGRSKVLLYDVGLMLAMLLQSRCKNVIAGMFGETWKVVNVPKRSVLQGVKEFYRREGEVGYSTNGHKVIKWLINSRKEMDKVMMFTDMQMWDSDNRWRNTVSVALEEAWKEYKHRVSPGAKLYLFDLAGYGNVPLRFENNDVCLISGWSDKVFEVLNALAHGGDALEVIRSIEV